VRTERKARIFPGFRRGGDNWGGGSHWEFIENGGGGYEPSLAKGGKVSRGKKSLLEKPIFVFRAIPVKED